MSEPNQQQAEAAEFGRLSPWRDTSAALLKVARELSARFADLGMVNMRTRGFVPLESGGYYANRAERSAEAAAKSGAITGDEHARWLQELRAEIAAKRFLGGQVHLFVWGIRPGA